MIYNFHVMVKKCSYKHVWKCSSKEIKAAFELGENGFQKCFSVNAGVWLCMENTFSGNTFQS